MKRNARLHASALAGLLAAVLASSVLAAEPSGCIICHLDEAMIVKNLSGARAKTSAMQSGSG